jgi:hypothetical protein
VATSPRWTFTESARTVHRLKVPFERVGDEQWILLQSDVHWDNPKCDWDLLTKHWQQAKERNAPILDNGDFFCAMQGKWDKRANKDDLRPEHQTATYLDSLVSTAANALKPYQHLLTLRGFGNHETAIIKRHETNLTERLVERLKVQGASQVATGGYTGFIVIDVDIRGRRFPIKLFYHHGWGGGGPVTKGTIQANRMAAFVDADLVWSGHTHDEWKVPYARLRLNNECTRVEHTRQVHFRTPGYKEEFGDGRGGWHVERGGPPKPTGAAWLHIRHTRNAQPPEWEIREAI